MKKIETITVDELKQQLDQNKAILIDVRETFEYKTASIKGSKLIPLNEIDIQKLPHTKKNIVIHCRSGKRSTDACTKLLTQDPTLKIYSLEGGILAWEKAGFKVEKTASKLPPIERQTQIAIGIILILITLFGTITTPTIYLLSGIIGIALIFAGISGWCGMAKLLSKMPWNK